ncbi:MAG: DUF5107 domain-containing protein [Bacteroidales bacterium]|nr:DUF5107 domain-containing protein [Bacteroidales bacterium]
MKRLIIILAVSVLSAIIASAQESTVKMWEGKLELPSYILEAPETAPIFDRAYSYQRARRSIYPYPLNDNMTRRREIQAFQALFLENEYIQLCILPQIGGRLFYALDKTDGYDIFYRNDCIKPANVGMTGAWISGGVEWNVFHHHRSTSHTPCDWRMVEDADGSKTIWVGETELRHRMSWAIGVTLHPGISYIEVTGRLINSTPDANSMLYWSNIATKVDENYQIIYPQSVDFGTYHCKEAMIHWPVSQEAFRGNDDYIGVDVSWWKNLPTSNSIFIFDQKDDFFGGYDHGADAGTVLVGNHHIVKGGKFWLWGPNSEWDTRILSEHAGHYCELMQGAYSDNQPDYNWTMPYEVKEFKQYWYGVQKMGGFKAADAHAAINLDLKAPGKAFIAANATSQTAATIVLKAPGHTLFSHSLTLAPDAPFSETVSIDKTLTDTDLTLELLDAEGRVMLTFTPVEKDYGKPLPEIVRAPALPQDIPNNEECYYVGMRNLQFHNPYVNPTDYFLEVLRRDPDDVRCNTAMGIWYRQRGDYERAKTHLRRAIRRQTHDYTRPKDTEALYNLGLILKEEGQLEAAMDTLYRAVWAYEYNSAGNYQLAQIYSCMGDTKMALNLLEEAITYNGNNFSALGMKASLLRHAGDSTEALSCVDAILSKDPLNAYATYEKMLLIGEDGFHSLMRDVPESYLELSLEYRHNGFPTEADAILRDIDSRVAYPTVKLYLGNYADALALPTDYCNVFRLETVHPLEAASAAFPDSWKPDYYLGNLWYDKQPGKAIECWKRCLSKNPSIDLAWRNLGWANWLYTKDLDEALRCYRKAVELNPTKAIYLEELDQLSEEAKVPVCERYSMLKSHHETAVKRYTPLANEVITGTFCGDYDYVLQLLQDCYFPTREGVANFHDAYADALMMAGLDKESKGLYKEALSLYARAFEYPENQQVFLVDKRVPRDAQTWYMMGHASEKAGMRSKAREYYKNASEVRVKKTEYRYWQAMALRKIGRSAEAEDLFRDLESNGSGAIVESVFNFYGAEGTTGQTVETVNTKAYYMKGLGMLGLGDQAGAAECFRKALKCRPNNLWADYMLKNL